MVLKVTANTWAADIDHTGCLRILPPIRFLNVEIGATFFYH